MLKDFVLPVAIRILTPRKKKTLENRTINKKNIYRGIFWTGYILMIAISTITIKNDLHKITVGIVSFTLHFDQILHALVYFLICLYYAAGRKAGLNVFKDHPTLKFMVSVIFLSIITETVQIFIPERAFNVFDIIANLIGIAMGLIVIKGMDPKR